MSSSFGHTSITKDTLFFTGSCSLFSVFTHFVPSFLITCLLKQIQFVLYKWTASQDFMSSPFTELPCVTLFLYLSCPLTCVQHSVNFVSFLIADTSHYLYGLSMKRNGTKAGYLKRKITQEAVVFKCLFFNIFHRKFTWKTPGSKSSGNHQKLEPTRQRFQRISWCSPSVIHSLSYFGRTPS